MRNFRLVRDEDVTGYSGTGVVAEGTVFSDGTAVIRWCAPGKPASTVCWDSVDDAIEVHGHGGATRLVWAGRAHPPSMPAPQQDPVLAVRLSIERQPAPQTGPAAVDSTYLVGLRALTEAVFPHAVLSHAITMTAERVLEAAIAELLPELAR